MLGNTADDRTATLGDDVTVCVPGSMLAPAPAAEAPPVFVDDSGLRRKLIRATGAVVMLLLVGFLGLVGVALAVPSVGATVGLGNVTPFLIPGAAAKPPAVVVQRRVQAVVPVRRTAVKPAVAPTTQAAPKKQVPPTSAPPTSAPPTSAPPTSAPPTSAPPTTVPPTSAAPPSSAPPVVDAPKPADPAPAQNAPAQPVLAQNG